MMPPDEAQPAGGEPRPTPLRAVHERLGATMTGFAGWLMPLRYRSEIAEHKSVRGAAGLFDLSHMGEIAVSRPGAAAALDYALTGYLSALQPRRARYTMICAPDGGVLDALIVYRLGGTGVLVGADEADPGRVGAPPGGRAGRRAGGTAGPEVTRRRLEWAPGEGATSSRSPIRGSTRCATTPAGGPWSPAARCCSPAPAIPGRTVSSSSPPLTTRSRCGWRCPGPGRRTGSCPPGSRPAIRSGSRPACRCQATNWDRE